MLAHALVKYVKLHLHRCGSITIVLYYERSASAKTSEIEVMRFCAACAPFRHALDADLRATGARLPVATSAQLMTVIWRAPFQVDTAFCQQRPAAWV